MQAGILTPRVLFGTDVRYVIPTFQRPYVWTQDAQWEPLWQDVRDTADDYLEALDRLGTEQRAAAEQATTPHFLGAVVLQQQASGPDEPQRRDVIDGQQRLTTLQLLLDAAEEVFEEAALKMPAARMASLVLNNPVFAANDQDHRYKVWPTEVDREAFRHAMQNELPVGDHAESAIVQAHEFFQLQIREWLHSGPSAVPARASALETALMGLLQLVVIDLEQNDPAHIIFETLNARGTPLLQSDLVKNYLLYRASDSSAGRDRFHRAYWKSFDTPWWRKEIGQGRLTRPRIDVFLNYWLAMETKTEVSPTKVFETFQGYAKSADIESIAGRIRVGGDTYQRLDEHDGDDDLMFFYRWKVMDAGVITPLLLRLFSVPEEQLSKVRRQRALAAIESFLVRRMVCRMTAKDYNRLTLDLVTLLDDQAIARADDVVVEYLGQQSADSRIWPTDQQVADAVLHLPLFRLLTRSRLRIVLEALEASRRDGKSEEQVVARNLSIEHLMPQGWRNEHWQHVSSTASDDADVAIHRDRLIHTLGNLTLVSGKMNASLSNGPWLKKAEKLNDKSVLLLNSEVEKEPDWDEEGIDRRGSRLAQELALIWPGPTSI